MAPQSSAALRLARLEKQRPNADPLLHAAFKVRIDLLVVHGRKAVTAVERPFHLPVGVGPTRGGGSRSRLPRAAVPKHWQLDARIVDH